SFRPLRSLQLTDFRQREKARPLLPEQRLALNCAADFKRPARRPARGSQRTAATHTWHLRGRNATLYTGRAPLRRGLSFHQSNGTTIHHTGLVLVRCMALMNKRG